jgi:magnesium-transporting ATPase (P-type)
VRQLGDAIVGILVAYFVFAAILFPVMLVSRACHVSERTEKRLLNAIAWLVFLIPVGALVVLTIAHHLSPNG